MHRSVVVLFVFLVALTVCTSIKKGIRVRIPYFPSPDLPGIRVRFFGAKRANAVQGGISEHLAEAFMLLDTNADGFIDTSEIKTDINTFFPGKYNNPADFISEADTDGDGNVSFNEFFAKFQNGPTDEE